MYKSEPYIQKDSICFKGNKSIYGEITGRSLSFCWSSYLLKSIKPTDLIIVNNSYELVSELLNYHAHPMMYNLYDNLKKKYLKKLIDGLVIKSIIFIRKTYMNKIGN